MPCRSRAASRRRTNKGITHRDLKPENVFITRDDRIKILDFGLAKLTQDQPASATRARSPRAVADAAWCGARHRRLHGARAGARTAVDHRADLFAFGAILYELLSGRPRVSPRHGARRRWRRSSMMIRRISARLRLRSRRPSCGSSIAASRRIRRSDFRPPAISHSRWTACRTRRACRQPRAPAASGPQRRGSAGAPRRCCWRRWRRSRTSTSASGLPRPARCASRFLRSSNWRGREISACLRTAVTWRSSGAARMGSRGSGSAPWIRWKSALFPVRRPPTR